MENILITALSPHPDNPRKQLGDLSELTESIKTFGVLQNLTVVPGEEEGQYTVVCGHRRLAAALKAGLKELPCQIIENMDRKTQLSTMLLENMQRSDLTPQEEAQGFQMMLELGGSIAEICKQTGLSETKVRHRVKLNELDQKLLAEKMKGEISINDLIKLERIKDPARRNEALGKIGTNNFDWAVENAITEERKEYVLAKLTELLPDVERTQGWSPYPEVCKLEYRTCSDEEIVQFAETLKAKAEEEGVPALLSVGYEWAGKLKKERQTTSTGKAEVSPEEKARRRRIDDLGAMKNRMVESCRKFVEGVQETAAKRQAGKILPYAAEYLVTGWRNIDADDMLSALGEQDGEGDTDSMYHIACLEEPYRIILIATFEAMAPTGWRDEWWDNNGKYIADMSARETAAEMYSMIAGLGYEVSDDEAGFLVGDSDLYYKEK